MNIAFYVQGEPQGKARPRVVKNKYTGKSCAYTPQKTIEYEELVQNKYKAVSNGYIFPKNTALEISISASFSIPKSTPKKAAQEIKKGLKRPTKKPDCDNIAKVICDALNKTAYYDDSQIVKLTVEKWYSNLPYTMVGIKNYET